MKHWTLLSHVKHSSKEYMNFNDKTVIWFVVYLMCNIIFMFEKNNKEDIDCVWFIWNAFHSEIGPSVFFSLMFDDPYLEFYTSDLDKLKSIW